VDQFNVGSGKAWSDQDAVKHLLGTLYDVAQRMGHMSVSVEHLRNSFAHLAELSGRLNEIFGKGNFFLEIQNHGIPEQIEVARGAVEISKELDIPLVLTNDSHFLTRNDQKAQDAMLRIQMNKKITDPLEFGFNEEFYVKSAAEMARLYPELPQAMHNTLEIAEMCNFDFEFGAPLLPDFKIPPGMSLGDYLVAETIAGLSRRFDGSVPPKHRERLQYELDVIKNMGFEGYFLIVADFINYAKRSGIPVGPGRGSAVGSLVAYSLGITDLDPLKYDLLFERFLNPSRKEMPDIDVDFCRAVAAIVRRVLRRAKWKIAPHDPT
jgi:DNA polymerase-3 subunit alpha